MDSATLIAESAVRLAALLAFAGVGEWIAERAGTLNISIEAMLLGAAYAGVVGSDITGSVAGGVLFAVVASVVVAALQANLAHRISANQFVVGLALNALVIGLTAFLNETYTSQPETAGSIRIPLLADIPVIGTALFDVTWLIYPLYFAIPVAFWLVHRTRWGLEVRAVGEDPQSADVTGIQVNKRRRQSLYVLGVFAGLGGAFLTLGGVGVFSAGMTGGRGYLAIAAVIFGGWTLRGTIAGALLFGTADALRLALPALGVQLNSQLLVAAPYVLALTAMLLFASRTRQPAALGRPFERGLA